MLRTLPRHRNHGRCLGLLDLKLNGTRRRFRGACFIIILILSVPFSLTVTSNPLESLGNSNRQKTTSILIPAVIVALAIRLIVMYFLLPEQLSPDHNHWHFGYEAGQIASAIVQGHGFSSPLFEETGPTAWMTPVYPYLIAAVFKLFGTFTTASAVILLSLNALMSALVCVTIFFIARRGFGERAAKWSAWAWAFCPYGIYFPVERIWETWLSTLLLSLLFMLTLQLESDDSAVKWAAYGLLWGLAALTSSMVLIVLPFLAFWAIWRRARNSKGWFFLNSVAAVAFIVVVAPWFIRNYEVFHRVIPFRDNMGLVLKIGTRGNSDYWGQYQLGPWHSEREWNEFKQLGELGYMDEKKQEAIAFIRANPGWYAWTSLRRAVFIWTGYWSLDREYLKQEPLDPPNILFCTALTILALFGFWRALQDNPAMAAPYAIALFVFPLIYYFTSPEVYYRRPVDPFFVILAVVAVLPRAIKKATHGRPVISESVMPELQEA